MYKPVPNNTSF